MIQETFTTKIAIVGLGPKGLYGLERLLANLAQANIHSPVEIHLFNKSDSFGAGDVYNPKQPTFLMMNYVNGYINMWSELKPKPIVPEPKSFVDWLTEHAEEFPEANAFTFSSRAVVGRYLSEGFNLLLDSCPDGVSILKHVGDVVDIEKEEDNYSIFYNDSQKKSVIELKEFQNILIATGHPCVNEPESLSQDHYIDFIYPVEKRLTPIPAGSKVAIKGMGLTFIDAVLALTEGRQGEFKKDESGNLAYLKSGLEPEKIYPFSMSGLMMIPRGNTFDEPEYKPFYFRDESFEFIVALDGKYDFERQLLPFIEQEFTAAFYSVLFTEKGEELTLSRDFTEVETQIESFHQKYPKTERFDFQSFLKTSVSDNDINKNTLQALHKSIKEAEIGVEKSAFATAAGLWRHLSDFFNELYKFGGLKPQSQKVFLENYAGHLNRISYGPPIENMKKIEAIAKAGLIDFSFSQNPKITKSVKYSLSVNENQIIQADYLVDARIPKTQLHRSAGKLYGSLLEKELIFPYVNRQEGRLDFRPGCLAIDEKGHPLDNTGLANKSLTFTGTPSEGLTYDNDTLSRKRNDFVSDWAKGVVEEFLSMKIESQINSNSY